MNPETITKIETLLAEIQSLLDEEKNMPKVVTNADVISE